MPAHQGGKSGSKKIGRNEAKCKRYKAEGRREINKIKKLMKHCSLYQNDTVAVTALSRVKRKS